MPRSGSAERGMSFLARAEMAVLGQYLGRDLMAAHMPVTADRYLRTTRINVAASLAIFTGFYAFVTLTGMTFGLFALIPAALFWALLFLGMVPGLWLYLVLYPGIVARGRKSRIDLDLPFAISYMQALSTTMSPFEVIRRIYEERAMFGEVSKEFGQVVRDVELFGDDLITAMHNLQHTTPSPILADFFNDLCIIFESGGDFSAYLASKTEYFHQQARRELDVVLKTMEIMAEVYVSAFVAGPIALIIMIVAQGMTSKGTMSWLLPFMYILIPAGAIVMIWILSLMLPPENLEVSGRESVEYGTGTSTPVLEEASKDPEFYRFIETKKRRFRIRDKLRHPLRTYISHYAYGIVLGSACAGIAAALVACGALGEVFPKNAFEAGICLIIIAFMAPVALSYECRKWYVNSIENNIPEFLRELADMKEIGLTLPDAIQRISSAKLGLLSSELTNVTRDVNTGSYVNTALMRMDQRIGLVSVKRAISLLVKAGEITSDLRQIIIIAITDFEHYLKMKRERANTAIVYVMIIYLSFGIYLFTAYQLNGPFMVSFSTYNINFNLAQNVTDMFRIAVILGAFSGIMAGQFSSNSILAGFKHSIVLLAAATVLFVFIV
ncbi:type II secretion system F family protein [Methanoregula sp.]|uniref:type II secretion system F family protein n=1 Tax=Methanoregula sp. TaxID=2052170 RepID=UPI002615F784|nr:type II secretion system F family protein [Methanoregula sp.]MDD5144351.1 type II secretion system F family protein [Methanoregula sp.]